MQAPFAFGRERRIRKRADFLRVQSGGRRVTSRHFTLLVDAQPKAEGNPGRHPSRLGIVVTRKLGGAVVRNRLKRLCRECFRTTPDLVPPGIDLVVIPRPGAERLLLAEVAAEWGDVRRFLAKRAAEALAHAAAKHHLSSAPPSPLPHNKPIRNQLKDGPSNARSSKAKTKKS